MRLILILGEGAIGKHTFVNALEAMEPASREKYYINTKKVKFITFQNGNKIYELLKKSEGPLDIGDAECVVLKWQLSLPDLAIIKEKLSATEVVGVMFEVDPEIKDQRQKKKHPQLKTPEDHDFAAYSKFTSDRLEEMRNSYDIYITVNGNKSKYELLEDG